MTRVLITGNSGYIGSHLTEQLSTQSVEIHGLDKQYSSIKVSKFIHKDITDTLNWEISSEYDAVVHLAAEVSVGPSVTNPTSYYITNVLGTLNVLKNTKTRNFILASTGSAVGLGSPYGISKRMAEDVVIQYCKEHNIAFTIFRFYNVTGTTGAGMRNDTLLACLLRAKETGVFNLFGTDYNTKDGTCIRDYTHVSEICHGIRRGLEKPTGAIENLGHGVGTSVKEMIDIFKRVNNCDFEIINCPRRIGDLESSVLTTPSQYMQKLYDIDQLLLYK